MGGGFPELITTSSGFSRWVCHNGITTGLGFLRGKNSGLNRASSSHFKNLKELSTGFQEHGFKNKYTLETATE
jgi:hypothetical protein